MSGGRAVTRANRVGVEKACLAAKEVMIASAVASGLPHPPALLRGVGKGGARWNVRYDVKGYQNPVGIVRYVGPVHLMDRGTKPHWIAPRNSAFGRGGRSGAFALYFPSGDVRSIPVFHPGTKGKRFFDKAEPVVVRQSSKLIHQEVRSHLARTFAG